jgi:predicted dehydrogenase
MSGRGRTRVGLIGAGFVAARHAEILAGFDDVQLVAVADPVEQRARELAGRHDARPLADHVPLLENIAVDALFICVPPFARGAPELAAVRRRLPFFVEKPLAADLRTAERIAEALAATKLPTAVGYHWRYLESTRRARALLASRPVRLVQASWFDTTPSSSWWSRAELSGGQMVEQVTHLLDLARHLVGEVDEVYGAAGDPGARPVGAGAPRGPAAGGDAAVSPACAAVLHFASGALGVVSATCALGHKFGAGLQLFCDGLAVEFSEFGLRAEAGDDELVDELRSCAAQRPGIRRAARAAQDRDFVDAVRGKPSQVRVGYQEALRTHRLAVAVARSTLRGRPVRVGGQVSGG